jgi:hypothetical protein
MERTTVLLLSISSMLIWSSLKAQRPADVASQGSGTLTIGEGRYCETFEDDTLRRVGMFVYNTVTGRAFCPGSNGRRRDHEEPPTTTSESRSGRWLSLDPQAGRYCDLSPYQFVANSPIIAIDPNGEEIVITGSAEFRAHVVAELQKLTDHKVKIKADGTVVVRHRLFGPKTSKPFGTELVRELARDKDHLVTVSETQGHTGTTAENEKAAFGAVDGGSNSRVALNLDEQISVLNEFGDGEEQPDQITLGRELLYARDYASGTAEGGLALDQFGVYMDPDAIDGSIPLTAEEYKVRKQGESRLRWEQDMLQRAEPKKSEVRFKEPLDLQMTPIPNDDQSKPPTPKKK